MLLEDLLHHGEGWDLEFKKAAGRDGRGAIPASLWETYSAMANSYGGTIVLGVEELPDGGLQVLGIGEPEKIERDLWNSLYDRNKVSANLVDRQGLRRETLDGKELLVLRVPRAPRGQRPVYIHNNPLTGTYIRGHEGDRRCSPEEVRRMLADADASHSQDSRILPGHTISDLDPESLSAYRQLFRLSSPSHLFLDFPAASVQSSEHFGGKISEGSSEHFTAFSGQSTVQSSEHSAPLPGESIERSAVLLRVYQTRYAAREDVKGAILLVCRGRFVTLNDLAEKLNRSPETLRTHYLAEMVEAGELRLRYPHKPRHPSQAYRTAKRRRRT